MDGKYRYLTYQDRRKIAAMWLAGEGAKAIAEELGVHTATVYNELNRGQGDTLDQNRRLAYDPDKAQKIVQAGFKRRGKRRAV